MRSFELAISPTASDSTAFGSSKDSSDFSVALARCATLENTGCVAGEGAAGNFLAGTINGWLFKYVLIPIVFESRGFEGSAGEAGLDVGFGGSAGEAGLPVGFGGSGGNCFGGCCCNLMSFGITIVFRPLMDPAVGGGEEPVVSIDPLSDCIFGFTGLIGILCGGNLLDCVPAVVGFAGKGGRAAFGNSIAPTVLSITGCELTRCKTGLSYRAEKKDNKINTK